MPSCVVLADKATKKAVAEDVRKSCCQHASLLRIRVQMTQFITRSPVTQQPEASHFATPYKQNHVFKPIATLSNLYKINGMSPCSMPKG